MRRTVWFAAPGRVEVREEPVPAPAPGEVLVASIASGISAGTELLVYRGEAPPGLPVDATIAALAGTFRFPLAYGYAVVGRVVALGAGVAPEWLGRAVFAFRPHTSHFTATPADLHPLPPDLDTDAAVLLPGMETAVTLLLDGAPLIGERVVVFGQGVVGLLTTALLAACPLRALVTLDRWPLRRERSLALGAGVSLDPADADLASRLGAWLDPAGADLVYELSGVPAALDAAIGCAGYAGRVMVGSWYGTKRVSLDLGSHFHRARIQIISSQVSTLSPARRGRWDTRRRLEVAWARLRGLRPDLLITHRFPVERAADAYALLDRRPAEALQVVLTY